MTNFNEELRKIMAVRIYEKQYVDLSPGAKRDVEDTISAITELVKGIVPSEEISNDLCRCFIPDEFIDEKENLIKCKVCNKQMGEKSWNACRTEMLRKLQ